MLIGIIRLLASAAWLAATAFLATSTASTSPVARIAAAFVVGLPGAFEFARSAGQLLGVPRRQVRRRVNWVLKSALIDLHRQKTHDGRNVYDDDISQVSLHVWVIPLLYRKLVPDRVRRRRTNKNGLPTWLRSPLVRFSMYRLEYRGRSKISFFRKGVGLVGRCVDMNDKELIHIVRFDSENFICALHSDDEWDASTVDIHQNLSRQQGEELAKRYSQAAAIVLQEASGEAIGCVTLDLPPKCSMQFQDAAGRGAGGDDPLRRLLRTTAEAVENHLTNRP